MKSGYLLSLLLVVAGCKNSASSWPMCKSADSRADGGLGAPDLDGGVANVACFYAPTAVAARTACSSSITSSCASDGNATPNLSCLQTTTSDGGADMTTDTTSLGTVTLTGFIHVFDNGGNGDKVTLSLFNGDQLATGVDPAALVPLGSSAITLYQPQTYVPSQQGPGKPLVANFPWLACDKDLSLGCSVAITSGCAVTCNDGLNGNPDKGQYCRDDGHGGVCSDRLRWEASYSQIGVPVGQLLVVRVTGANARADSNWATTLQWNVEIPPSNALTGASNPLGRDCTSPSDSECYQQVVDSAGNITTFYRLNVTAMSQLDYSHLGVLAGLPGGQSFNHGIVLGEVHDCDGVRLQNAEVAMAPLDDRFSYFTSDTTTMTPTSRRASTDPLGRFAAFNQAPGKIELQSGGELTDGGAFTLFGATSAFVYANSVSIVNVGVGF
ncbi:MAG TPA: hypothetical protein VIA18_15055 [Polyangia bacterium]|nr:hypothetical protein [Polyangia bacterium]